MTEADLNPSKGEQDGSCKRKATLVAVTNLRRSKRQATKNDGFKPASPAVTRSRSKSRKSSASITPSSDKRSTFCIPYSEFPDLGVIHKCVPEQLIHPHISIPVLQKVAQELCGFPPEEVIDEVLLRTDLVELEERSSSNNNLQIVPYEVF
jgi:hypothetical protein